MLIEHEMNIQDEETKTEKAYITKSSTKVSKYHHQYSSSSSEEGSSIKYHLCDGDYAFQFYNQLKLTRKLLKQYLYKQKFLKCSDKKISLWAYSKKPSNKTHKYKTTCYTLELEAHQI
jgi:hypothetical protein